MASRWFIIALFAFGACGQNKQLQCQGDNLVPSGRGDQEEARLAVGDQSILSIPEITHFSVTDGLCRGASAPMELTLAVHDTECDLEYLAVRIRTIGTCAVVGGTTVELSNIEACDKRSYADRNLDESSLSATMIQQMNVQALTATVDTRTIAPSSSSTQYFLELYVKDRRGQYSDLKEHVVAVAGPCTPLSPEEGNP